MRRVLMVFALVVAACLAVAGPVSASWACVSIIPVDSAVCVDDPLPDPLPLPDSVPADPSTVGL